MSDAANRWEKRIRLAMTRDRVGRLLDDMESTVPLGIDPETIAAARRIARRLDEADDGG